MLTLLLTATLACGQSDLGADEPPAIDPSAAIAPPAGVQAGEPYRWLARSWNSPLGLTVRTYGLAVDGLPVYGRHQIEVYSAAGTLVYRAGTGDAVLADLRARSVTTGRHPRASLSRTSTGPTNPLVRTKQRAVWSYRHGELVAAVITDRLDLLDETPVGEVTVNDAVSGAELTGHRTIFELNAPEYRVYTRPDGRPWTSPLGNALPHPTGVPDGSVPPPVPQQLRTQRTAIHALSDPWLPPGATQSSGNNVVAFFDSLLDRDGNLADLADEDGNNTPEYGPAPDDIGNDFFAHPTGNRFAFPYDANATASEYFQPFAVGEPFPPPDPDDVALNAKIVQAFYSTNWLHDFFYRAGYDEVAGNPQQSNYGRGGVEGDPLIAHAGFLSTFTFPAPEGESPVLDLGLNSRSASQRDFGMDFSVLSHEWGHTLIGRLAGGTGETDGLSNLQGQSLHEGIADFVGILVNYNAGNNPHDTFTLGGYGNLDYIERRPTLPPGEAPSDMYFGIRRYPYTLDLTKNPLTLRHLAVPPPVSIPFYNWKGRGPLLNEVHTAGEVFGTALFQCFGNIVNAHPHADFESVRLRMAQYLVAGLAAFRERPSFLDARNAFLTVIRLTSPFVDYPACRAGFAARGMGADSLGPDREFGSDGPFGPPPYDPADIQESYLDTDRALRLTASSVTGTSTGTLRVDLRNTGLVDLAFTVLEVKPAVPAAVRFPHGPIALVGAIVPEQVASPTVPVVINPCRLPADPAQPGFRAFDYTVKATAPGLPTLQREATFHASVAAGACP